VFEDLLRLLVDLVGRELQAVRALLLTSLTETVSVIELLWTSAALAVTVRYLQRAILAVRRRRRLLQQDPAVPLTVCARERIRVERALALMVIAELLAGLGLLGMLQPQPAAAAAWDPLAFAAALYSDGILIALFLKGEIVERRELALVWLYEQQIVTLAAAAAEQEVTSYSVPHGQTGRHVLIVDDEAPILALLRHALEGEGEYVRVLVDPTQLDTVLADGWTPDVAIVDLMMPGLDGSQVARILRARYPQLRVIVYSARPGAAILQALRAEITDGIFLAKPFDLHTLIALVRGRGE
jgi:CheY-like chemotaxis protein